MGLVILRLGALTAPPIRFDTTDIVLQRLHNRFLFGENLCEYVAFVWASAGNSSPERALEEETILQFAATVADTPAAAP